ncbi:universal stress protein [Tengunoibacter tsumagoiensis]|uniref:UspA domain-containing protein n=1 Tax=Tengunoibacter tsumagoiensis TaxID=2014871 RepID=A0A402A4K6_9CHLR|nr:universal stress protein [Tengunoibacter tsumagoiensis]GCE14040.1 hypothetical protein KTT_38990 [Tengunoibacter tsumagoiensis]
MRRYILLGVERPFSPSTQYQLQTVYDLIETSEHSFSLLLLTVLPPTHILIPPSTYALEQASRTPPSYNQQQEARLLLQKTRAFFQQRGFEYDDIEELICMGAPADEIIKVANERHVHLIVIGNHGHGFWQQCRRFFFGSVSAQILKRAPCPVLVALPAHSNRTAQLVSWYIHSLQQYLQDHTQLTVLTAEQVAQQFLPKGKRSVGRPEIKAASQALEMLSQQGLLCRHEVRGEIRYAND